MFYPFFSCSKENLSKKHAFTNRGWQILSFLSLFPETNAIGVAMGKTGRMMTQWQTIACPTKVYHWNPLEGSSKNQTRKGLHHGGSHIDSNDWSIKTAMPWNKRVNFLDSHGVIHQAIKPAGHVVSSVLKTSSPRCASHVVSKKHIPT